MHNSSSALISWISLLCYFVGTQSALCTVKCLLGKDLDVCLRSIVIHDGILRCVFRLRGLKSLE